MDSDLFFETDTSDLLTGLRADDTQIAAVASATVPLFDDALPRPFDATQVVVPDGATVVRIPMAPGEVVVELPFPADGHFLARIADGNLAIKVGDVTVILQGYIEAAGQTPPVIEAANGQPLDIAAILAATDPALEIETAAGPADPQGQGADNTGALFRQLGETTGLGGFQSVGAQAGTDGSGGGAEDVGGGTMDQTRALGLPSGTPGDVVAVNVAPIAIGGIDLIGALEDTPNIALPLGWVVIDPDDAGHTITLDESTLPGGVSYSSETETFYFNIAFRYDYLKAGEAETFPLKFTITDDRGASTERDLSLSIIGTNDGPIPIVDVVVVDAGAELATLPLWALAANDLELEGEAMHVSSLGGIPRFGDETLNVVMPADGSRTEPYIVSDGTIDSQPSVVIFTHDAVADGDIIGTDKYELLVGTLGPETLDGGGGDDIIDGQGGSDEIFGGAGDDIMVFSSSGSKIHGQNDTVNSPNELMDRTDKHGDVMALYFGEPKRDFSDHVSVAGMDGIETISMQAKLGGGSDQSLTIGAHSVQDLSDHTITPGGVFAEHDAIRIDGDAVDQLYLSISKDGGSWTDTGVDANGYQIYAHEATAGDASTADAYVMVSTAIPAANVHLNADAP